MKESGMAKEAVSIEESEIAETVETAIEVKEH